MFLKKRRHAQMMAMLRHGGAGGGAPPTPPTSDSGGDSDGEADLKADNFNSDLVKSVEVGGPLTNNEDSLLAKVCIKLLFLEAHHHYKSPFTLFTQ